MAVVDNTGSYARHRARIDVEALKVAHPIEEVIARYGEVQGRFEELDGYAMEGRAREVLAGLSFSQEMMEGDVGKLFHRPP